MEGGELPWKLKMKQIGLTGLMLEVLHVELGWREIEISFWEASPSEGPLAGNKEENQPPFPMTGRFIKDNMKNLVKTIKVHDKKTRF